MRVDLCCTGTVAKFGKRTDINEIKPRSYLHQTCSTSLDTCVAIALVSFDLRAVFSNAAC